MAEKTAQKAEKRVRKAYDNGAKRYTYRIFWSHEDQEFVRVWLEFGPKLSNLNESPEAALHGIIELVREVLRTWPTAVKYPRSHPASAVTRNVSKCAFHRSSTVS